MNARQDYSRSITFQHLESLAALAETGSFSRAAQRLHLSQPSLTRHIQNLEELAGTPLVVRQREGGILTSEGLVLLDYARRILRLREDAWDKLSYSRDGGRGRMNVAASTIPATYILPRVISAWHRLQPGITVNVQTHDSEEALQAVLHDQAEIGLVGKKTVHRGIVSVALWSDRIVLAVSPDHPWAGERELLPEQLSEGAFIGRERGSATRATVEAYIRAETGLDPSCLHALCEVGSSEAVKEAVLAGVGPAFISVHAVRREVEAGRLRIVPVRGWNIERSFHLIHKKNFRFKPHHALFLDFLKEFRTGDEADQTQSSTTSPS
ncbi:MAG: LysR family transcriptional regulator [Syntrophaceae bacterium]|nr:LysR family transcriptional regulator [Syntrophaceae bacterium]